jgi:TPR repeat protein
VLCAVTPFTCPSWGAGRETALTQLQTQAEQGEAEAQFRLGVLYVTGDQGIDQDYRQAREWFLKAAGQGHLPALHNVGELYYQGAGVRQDYSEAAKWFARAAEKGFPGSQHNLGQMHLEGLGVPKDPAQGMSWLRKAAQSGFARSQSFLGLLLTEQGPSGWDEAFSWLHKAAEQGDPDAQFNLASAYWTGRGCQVDKTKSVEWYQKAADQGFEPALQVLKTVQGSKP